MPPISNAARPTPYQLAIGGLATAGALSTGLLTTIAFILADPGMLQHPAQGAVWLVMVALVGGALGSVIVPWTTRAFLPDTPLWQAVAGPALGALAANAIVLLSVGPLPGFACLPVGYAVAEFILHRASGTPNRGASAHVWFGAALFIFALGVAASAVNVHLWRRAELRDYLNLASLPSGVRHLNCDSYSWLDYTGKCDFTIDGDNFESLLAGRKFEMQECHGQAFKLGGWTSVGTDFAVDRCFDANGRDGRKSLNVRLIADHARHHAAVFFTTGP